MTRVFSGDARSRDLGDTEFPSACAKTRRRRGDQAFVVVLQLDAAARTARPSAKFFGGGVRIGRCRLSNAHSGWFLSQQLADDVADIRRRRDGERRLCVDVHLAKGALPPPTRRARCCPGPLVVDGGASGAKAFPRQKFGSAKSLGNVRNLASLSAATTVAHRVCARHSPAAEPAGRCCRDASGWNEKL